MLNLSKLIIDGGQRIIGEIKVQGAKNAVLPILAATILADGESVIHNCPKLRDVDKTDLVLEQLGCVVKREDGTVSVNPCGLCGCQICEELMRQMRSSIIFLGAIVSRCREAMVSMPGGCPIGLRPIDLHLKALRELGVEISEKHGYIHCTSKGIHGANIHLDNARGCDFRRGDYRVERGARAGNCGFTEFFKFYGRENYRRGRKLHKNRRR